MDRGVDSRPGHRLLGSPDERLRRRGDPRRLSRTLAAGQKGTTGRNRRFRGVRSFGLSILRHSSWFSCSRWPALLLAAWVCTADWTRGPSPAESPNGWTSGAICVRRATCRLSPCSIRGCSPAGRSIGTLPARGRGSSGRCRPSCEGWGLDVGAVLGRRVRLGVVAVAVVALGNAACGFATKPTARCWPLGRWNSWRSCSSPARAAMAPGWERFAICLIGPTVLLSGARRGARLGGRIARGGASSWRRPRLARLAPVGRFPCALLPLYRTDRRRSTSHLPHRGRRTEAGGACNTSLRRPSGSQTAERKRNARHCGSSVPSGGTVGRSAIWQCRDRGVYVPEPEEFDGSDDVPAGVGRGASVVRRVLRQRSRAAGEIAVGRPTSRRREVRRLRRPAAAARVPRVRRPADSGTVG